MIRFFLLSREGILAAASCYVNVGVMAELLTSETLQLGSHTQTIDLPQAKKPLKKYDLNILNHDGVNSVVVPDELFKDSFPL